MVASLSALALVIVAVGGFLIYRSTTGGSSTPTASGSPAPAAPAGWQLGPASPFPVQQLHAAVLDGRIWLAGGLTGSTVATDKATDKTRSITTWRLAPGTPDRVCRSRYATRCSVSTRKPTLADRWLPAEGPNLTAASRTRC